MRPEHLATIRRAYDAINRRDLDALRALESMHPDFSWESAPVEETIDLGPSQVILRVRHRIRGAASGAAAERDEVHLWTVRDGRVASLREYRNVDEARQAAEAS